MTVATLIEQLQQLPGSLDIRPVRVIRDVRRQGQADTEEFSVVDVRLGYVTVDILVERLR